MYCDKKEKKLVGFDGRIVISYLGNGLFQFNHWRRDQYVTSVTLTRDQLREQSNATSPLYDAIMLGGFGVTFLEIDDLLEVTNEN